MSSYLISVIQSVLGLTQVRFCSIMVFVGVLGVIVMYKLQSSNPLFVTFTYT